MLSMLILTIRTDKPEAEIGLFDDDKKLAYSTWQAHRQLAETIHVRIHELLDSQGKQLKDLQAIIVFQGPGSFTGLRIGVSVANALAYGLAIPVMAGMGDNWINAGRGQLAEGRSESAIVPDYGSPPHVTLPKH